MANTGDKDTHSQENAQLAHLLGNFFPEIIYGFNKVLIPSWKAYKPGDLEEKKAAYFTASFSVAIPVPSIGSASIQISGILTIQKR